MEGTSKESRDRDATRQKTMLSRDVGEGMSDRAKKGALKEKKHRRKI